MAALVAQKDDLVAGLRQSKYLDVAEAYGFSFMQGSATFTGADELTVDGKKVVARAGYVIATGASPAVPDIVGINEIDYLTSTTAMDQSELPRSLIVIGGGYVGLEQAQLFAHLGSQVTIVGRIAPNAEPELAQVLRTVFADDGIDTIEEHAVGVVADGSEIVVTTASGRTVRAQRLLVATGRSANTAGLGLDAAGVRAAKTGFVSIDSAQRTSNPRIFAAGDVSGGPQYVYVAAATGAAAAANALGANEQVDYTGMPAIVFTKPQLASAGLTEAQAIANGHSCEARTLSLQDVPRALVNRETRGAVKLVSDSETGRVLGISAAADGAGEMMLAATYAIKAGFTVDQLAETWAPYLTMAESIRLVAQSFRNELPTSCCA